MRSAGTPLVWVLGHACSSLLQCGSGLFVLGIPVVGVGVWVVRVARMGDWSGVGSYRLGWEV